ncbi:MAG: MBL fold metallo-hydrolase [Burkholderiaceae bacterium]|nr:MBL fold metallo-hydrolase [Burkholderiaceae bacterium]
MSSSALLPADVRMLERGWLSSNSLLLQDHEQGAVLIDSGYCTHGDQTLALVQHALADQAQPSLRLIANTHLHSDHCGGNALLSQHFGCPIAIPPGDFDAALRWDETGLSYGSTGQTCPRFEPSQVLSPGSELIQGRRRWQIHAAPGHDPHSVVLFEPEAAILVSADALWQHGFGIVFPALGPADKACEQAFAEVEATLDLIEALPAYVVVPGHGPAFSDAKAALATARKRLAFFRANPHRHARHAAKALIKFRLLEVERQSRLGFLNWLLSNTVHVGIWQNYFDDQSVTDWSLALLQELAEAGALKLHDEAVINL